MEYFGVFLALMCAVVCEARLREYFIAMEEIEWDYAPTTLKYASPIYVERGPNRIGKVYKKAMYRGYTDDSFTVRTHRPAHLGLYGPILKAEVNDVLVVHAFNRASRPYSVHPHGVFYQKSSEGAWYKDNTTSNAKEDDIIEPGERHTYVWEVRDQYAPGPDDANCLTWAYHSHVHSVRDQASGLIGALITCKAGVLTAEGLRTDVDREFATIIDKVDENESWYIDENIQKYALDPDSVDKNDKDFRESNIMMGVNGRTALNLDGVKMCKGDLVNWYVIGMGSEIHVMQFVANTVIVKSHRQDTVTVFPATFITAEMRADNPGQWVFGCHVSHHGGMAIGYEVSEKCVPSLGGEIGRGLESLTDNVRTYYLSADEVEWNYAPSGINGITRRPIAAPGHFSHEYFKSGPDRIGGVYKKAVYREYTDASFTKMAEREPWMGILGPVIAAEVGDMIKVVFRNNASKPYMAEPHGVFIFNRNSAQPGETITYNWAVPQSVAPTAKDEDCLTYMYTSMSTLEKDQFSGLVGPLLICKRGTLEKTLKRKTYFLLMAIFDENLSPYFQENVEKYTDPSSVNVEDEDFRESNRMRTFNGVTFGNLGGIQLCAGEETDFRILAIGNEIDNHAFIIDGMRSLKHREELVGGVEVFPHSTATVTVVSASPGLNLIGCLISNHYLGMFAFYRSTACGPLEEWESRGERTYYVGAVEEMWDFLPERTDIDGNSVDDPDHEVYLQTRVGDGKFLGTKYKTAIYYEYTDDTFTVRKPKAEHLGFLGPVIKAEIGDVVKVVFKNMATRPYNIQPLGIYVSGMMKGPPVPIAKPGETITYTWEIRDDMEPAPNQPDCVSTMYSTFVTPMADVYSGLNGPVLICRKGTLELRKGGNADEEFYLLFNVFDENQSPYLDDNIREILQADPETFEKKDADFIESNKINHINGRMYHLPGLNMKKGDTIRWHFMATGEEDGHTVHFHANAFKHQGDTEQRGDVFNLMNGRVATVVMQPDAVGKWLLHCHVNKHVEGGMESTYTVTNAEVVCKRICDPIQCNSDKRLDCSLLGIGAVGDLINAQGLVRLEDNHTTRFVSASEVLHLDLSHNPELADMDVLKAVLSRFPSLHTVALNYINLSELPADVLGGNPRIIAIYARGNAIQTVSSAFLNDNPSLERVDLQRNDLRSMPHDVRVGPPHGLKRLDLRGNKKLVPECLNGLHVDRVKTTLCFGGIKALLEEILGENKA